MEEKFGIFKGVPRDGIRDLYNGNQLIKLTTQNFMSPKEARDYINGNVNMPDNDDYLILPVYEHRKPSIG